MGTIVDIAKTAGSFNTLLTAVQAAGLDETLSAKGPYTVFAPTDEAFAKLPTGTLEALLKDRAKLTAVLTYHVVPGLLRAADVAKSRSLKSAQGQAITVEASNGEVRINGAGVVQADVLADNGVIHAIDSVILPK